LTSPDGLSIIRTPAERIGRRSGESAKPLDFEPIGK
jgi:hypothetical protein